MPNSFLPPVARRVPKTTTLHGITLTDDYAWLREKEAPETVAYLEAENAYAEADTAALAPLREKLYDEMLSHIQQTDVSVPWREGAWWYYARTEEGRQYAIHCRKEASAADTTGPADDAAEHVLLDCNAMAEGHAFFQLGDMDVSDDGRWLAYTVDTVGFRQYTLRVKNLATGETSDYAVERAGSVAWAADNRTLFYTVEDEVQKRQHQLWRHTLGEAADKLVVEEADERFNLAVGRTRDGEYILLEAGSHITSETRYMRADAPESDFRVILPRRDEIEYSASHRNGWWLIRINDSGRNFRLVAARVGDVDGGKLAEMIPHRTDVMLEGMDEFADFFVASEREAGLEKLRLWRFDGDGFAAQQAGEITFPEPAYGAHLHINREYKARTFRYAYQSLVTPASVYEYSMDTGASTLLKQVAVPGGFDRTLYASERVEATAADGVKVPISLVYRRDSFAKPTRGANPLYVYGYGSYGYSLPLGFSSNRLSLLDRGVVLAYAHIRGGGDMGEPWHDAGKMLTKQNTFSDFIACVDDLAAQGYGDAARVAIEGGSAGGLLMGAVSNIAPQKFRAVVSHVPFVDVMNTMLDASLPLTVPEYEEWGNPNEEEYFKYMLGYSPYENLREAAYPAMLVKTSLHDSQVMYWEPAKYVAKLRTLNTGAHPLLLVTNMQAGHGGASGRYDYLKEIAFDYAFLLRELEVAL